MIPYFNDFMCDLFRNLLKDKFVESNEGSARDFCVTLAWEALKNREVLIFYSIQRVLSMLEQLLCLTWPWIVMSSISLAANCRTSDILKLPIE